MADTTTIDVAIPDETHQHIQPQEAPEVVKLEGITAQIEVISPERAVYLLGQNRRNRRLQKRRVFELTVAMKQGKYEFNGQSIQVAENGLLLNGQHRLWAVVESGVSVPMLVVYGLTVKSQDEIDTGKKRGFNDVLFIDGEANANKLASATRVVKNYSMTGEPVSAQRISYKFTNTELGDFLAEHPALRESVSTAAAYYEALHLMPFSMMGGLHYIFTTLNSDDDANEFFRLLVGGEVAEESPVGRLRRMLIKNMVGPMSGYPKRTIAALTIKAFNAWMKGEEIGLLKFAAGGAKQEPFPEIYSSRRVAGDPVEELVVTPPQPEEEDDGEEAQAA